MEKHVDLHSYSDRKKEKFFKGYSILSPKKHLIIKKGSLNKIVFYGNREKLNLSDLSKMKIAHDGKGFMADWLLERIQLTDSKTGKEFNFIFSQNHKFQRIKKNTIFVAIANREYFYLIDY